MAKVLPVRQTATLFAGPVQNRLFYDLCWEQVTHRSAALTFPFSQNGAEIICCSSEKLKQSWVNLSWLLNIEFAGKKKIKRAGSEMFIFKLLQSILETMEGTVLQQ